MVRLGSALWGGVHGVWGFYFVPAGCGDISVGRVLFPWVLEIMLSGPRLLLSALALGLCVGPCCGSAGPVFPLFVSFVRPPGGFLVSFVFVTGAPTQYPQVLQ